MTPTADKQDRVTIPSTWRPIWWARHKRLGLEYVVGREYCRGDNFRPEARRWKLVGLYQTPGKIIVSKARWIDMEHEVSLLIAGGVNAGWEVDDDIKAERAECICIFCRGRVVVHLYNRRKRDRCSCGAVHFCRVVRQGGKIVAEEEGWRKDGKERILC